MNKSIKKVLDEIKFYSPVAGGFLVVMGAILGGHAIHNNYHNNKEIKTEEVTAISKAKSLSGKEIYFQFKDGSQELIEESSWFNKQKKYVDLDGDNLVDRIYLFKGRNKKQGLDNILIRTSDFYCHQELFLEADKRLEETRNKYLNK